MELKGLAASPGNARGKARVILAPKDIENVLEGEIIVCKQTDPSFIVAMAKAKGIVTEIGGLTAHAAILARELGKPCVIQIQKATEVIKNGNMLLVDGDSGKVTVY